MLGMVGIVALGVEFDLRRHVRAGVLLLEHRNRRELRIAQIAFQIRIARALGQRRLVAAVGPDQPALLAHDDRGAGVLAHRQHAAGGDVGVLEKIVGDELVVVRRLRVLDDVFEAGKMRRAQQMIDVGERRLSQRAERLARHHQHVFAQHALDPHALGGDLAVGRLILAEREQRRVLIRRGRMGGEGGVHAAMPFRDQVAFIARPIIPSYEQRRRPCNSGIAYGIGLYASTFVTTGLDPVVHADEPLIQSATLAKRLRCMDCRVKPANDEMKNRSRGASAPEACGTK